MSCRTKNVFVKKNRMERIRHMPGNVLTQSYTDGRLSEKRFRFGFNVIRTQEVWLFQSKAHMKIRRGIDLALW